MAKRVKSDSPTLFDLAQPEKPSASSAGPQSERPYSDPQLFLGTSAFTASGWQGTFYPAEMKPAEYLGHYAKTFRTVEIDSTFYGTPVISTVENWYRRTPADLFSAPKFRRRLRTRNFCSIARRSSANSLKQWRR